MIKPVYVVDIIGEVIDKMTVPNIEKVYYEAGRSIQILKTLIDKDNSQTLKDKKYPLFAMLLPLKEYHSQEFYAEVKIDRIVLATLSKGTDDVLERYKVGGPFKSILYPMYYEFFIRLAQHPNVNSSDPDSFPHVKMDNPGQQPIGEGLIDYVDCIEILNLEFSLTQIKTC